MASATGSIAVAPICVWMPQRSCAGESRFAYDSFAAFVQKCAASGAECRKLDAEHCQRCAPACEQYADERRRAIGMQLDARIAESLHFRNLLRPNSSERE